MKFKLRKFIQIISYYTVPFILIVLSLINPQRRFFIGLGNLALIVIMIIMFIKPVSVLFENKFFRKALTYRREFGVLAFWLFLFHGTGLIYIMKLYNLNQYAGFDNYLFWGLIAGIGMIILGLTSNTFSVRLFKKNWGKIQLIAYPTFVLILIHAGLERNGRGLSKYLMILFIYLILKGFEYFKKNPL